MFPDLDRRWLVELASCATCSGPWGCWVAGSRLAKASAHVAGARPGGTATLDPVGSTGRASMAPEADVDRETSPEEEFARLTNPNQNVAIIGTRDCTYNHQQVSETRSAGLVAGD